MGDWYNDRSLFRTKALKNCSCKCSYMKLKIMADHITKKTNDEDATAEFMEMVIEAKKG